MIYYLVELANPSAHIFKVRMRVSAALLKKPLQLRLPAWIPGSYMVRDFAKHIINIAAHNHDGEVALQKIDKSTWQIDNIRQDLEIVTEIYAWDLSVRAAHLDESHGFFNGSALFLEALDIHCPCLLQIVRPEDERLGKWRVATTLTAYDAAPYDFGCYQAADYDELIDHPVELGDFCLYDFYANAEHAIAITGKHQADSARLCADLEKLCTYQQSLFGGEPPFARYLFLCTVTGSGYGGLEHRASSALIASRYDLPYRDMGTASDEYAQFLGLCSHEYFHAWNVKRIKPAAFTPFDLSREVHSELLWAFEGFTAYYDDLCLVRTGLISAQKYLQLLALAISRVLASPGRHQQCLACASFDAWTKFYQHNENSANATVSYYAKGAMVAFCLDVLIRSAHQNQKSLDDLMRLLWQRYWLDDIGRSQGVPEDGILQLCQELLPPSHRQQLADFWQNAIYGTDEIDIHSAFAYMGIDSDVAGSGTGGFFAKPTAGKTQCSIGAKTEEQAGGVKILSVTTAGACVTGGLSAGDVIIAIDGIRASQALVTRLLARAQVGDVWQISAFRRDELIERRIKIQARPQDALKLSYSATPSAAQQQNRQLWLSGTQPAHE